MNNDCFITEILNQEQKEQLLEMYKNESWSKERNAEDVGIMLENCKS